jgi:cytochrome c oxidase subunit 4
MTFAKELRTYWIVYITLMVLLVVTFAVSFLPLGVYNSLISLSIAFFKAVLIVLFFMHVKVSDALTKVFVISGALWLFILISLGMTDYLSRHWMEMPGHWPTPPVRSIP